MNSRSLVGAHLRELGLAPLEIRAYLALLAMGRASMSELAKRVRVSRVAVYPLVDALVRKGLVDGEPKHYGRQIAVAHPRRLVGMAVEQETRCHERVQALEAALPELMASYQAEHKPSVRYLEGREGFRALMQEIEESGQAYDHLGASEEPLLKLLGRENIERQVRRKDTRQLRRRLLLAREPWSEDYARAHRSPLREYRWLPPDMLLPTRLYLYGNQRVAFVSLQADVMIVVIEDSGIFALQKQLFERLWEAGARS